MREDKRNWIRKALSIIVEKADQTLSGQDLTVRYDRMISPAVPAGFDGYRLVQVSDLHSQSFGIQQEALLEAIYGARPDLVCVTGDLIQKEYEGEEKRRVYPFIQNVSRIAPTYAIEGNHENRVFGGRQLMMDMKQQGIHVLWNRGMWLEAGGDRIGIAGLRTNSDSKLRKEQGWDTELLAQGERAMNRFTERDFVILLAHCPEKIREYHRMGANLVLSGHAHGGLMKLPGGRALLAPGQGWLPSYTRGLYRYDRTVMEVSAGLGGPRIGIPKEVVCLELRRKR